MKFIGHENNLLPSFCYVKILDDVERQREKRNHDFRTRMNVKKMESKTKQNNTSYATTFRRDSTQSNSVIPFHLRHHYISRHGIQRAAQRLS